MPSGAIVRWTIAEEWWLYVQSARFCFACAKLGLVENVRGAGREPPNKNMPDNQSELPPRSCILVAEDEPSVRRLVVRGLEHLGHEVLIAENSWEAEQLWREHHDRIDLLVTDLRMPGGQSGWELSQKLRVEREELKVVYITGYSNELLRHASQLQENVDFIQKPFTIPLLSEVVCNRLRE